MHIKALRVFVESVLRYGLPPDFVCAVIKPKPGSEKKGREALNIQYAKLGKGAQMSKKDLDENQDEIQGILGDKEYSPFVFFELKWQLDEK
jgi:V-type H+-transporting ATPase subunit C